MRFFCIVLVLVVALLTVVDCALVASKLATVDSVRSLAISHNVVNSKRVLRVDTTEESNNEERAITIPAGLPNTWTKIKTWFSDFFSKIKTSFSEGKQIQAWLDQDKTPDEVFKLLKLDKGTKGLLASNKLQTWSVFMTEYNKKHPTKMVNMLGMLTKTYGNEAVAVMLEAARRDKLTRPLANKLQTQQLTAWALNGLSTDVVFQLLRVGEGGVTNLLQNKALNVWFYYFKQMNRYNKDWEVTFMDKLLTVYDDIPLAKAIEAAKKVKTTEFMGQQLQSFQFKKWLADGVEPATIFKNLKMDKEKWVFDPNVEIFRGYKTYYKQNFKTDR